MRDAGVTAAEVPTDAGPLKVTLGPLPQVTVSPDDIEPPPEEELPDGAYDPIKRAKQLARGST